MALFLHLITFQNGVDIEYEEHEVVVVPGSYPHLAYKLPNGQHRSVSVKVQKADAVLMQDERGDIVVVSMLQQAGPADRARAVSLARSLGGACVDDDQAAVYDCVQATSSSEADKQAMLDHVRRHSATVLKHLG